MYGDDEKRLIEKNAPALQSLMRDRMGATQEERLALRIRDALGSLDEPEESLTFLVARAAQMAVALTTLRPLSELHEDDGPVLLWRVPVEEPPHVGSVCDSDWSHLKTYYTHWSPLPRVR